MMHHVRWQLLMLFIVGLVLAGCGPRRFNNVNDQLRAERLELQEQVTSLEAQLENRLGEIETLRQSLARPEHPDLPNVDPPIFARVKFAMYTGPIDLEGDGDDDLIRLYVHTLDQYGRMLPVAGRATIQAAVIEEGQAPLLYAERVYEPKELDAAYRSTITGTHYTLELPLTDDTPNQLTVKVTITDAITGISHNIQQAFDLKN